jgi:hypothetical protein
MRASPDPSRLAGALVALLAALFAAGCPEIPDVRYRHDLPGTKPKGTLAGYVRYTGAAPDIAGDLETLVRRLERTPAKGPSITLAAAIHFGDAAYYRELQEILSEADLVLFEAIKPAGAPMPPPERAREELAPAVRKISELMNLRYQLAEIDYRRPNFVHCDMESEAFAARLEEKIARTRDEAIRDLLDGLRGRIFGPPEPEPAPEPERAPEPPPEPERRKRGARPFLLRAAAAGGFLSAPEIDDRIADLLFFPLEWEKRQYERGKGAKAFEDKYKHAFALNLASPEGDLESAIRALRERGGEAHERDFLARVATNLLLGIWSVILDERNELVIGRLKDFLARERPPRSVAIFYGAAHMPLFEKQLAELGYRPAGTERWVTAWAMDTPRK